METAVYNIEGKDTGVKIDLNDSIFKIEPNDHAIYLDVKQYLANNRQGTHCTKNKATVSGSTRKVKKQKGTGGARAGSLKNPLYVGGGRIFGPMPRDYRFKLNKKLKQLARKSALSYKASANSIIVLEDFNFDAPKTKNFKALQNNLKISDNKTLLVINEPNKNIYLSSRNLRGCEVVTMSEISTYKIMNASTLVLTKACVDEMTKLFTN
jgi:large subunit ribosomal protein L4